MQARARTAAWPRSTRRHRVSWPARSGWSSAPSGALRWHRWLPVGVRQPGHRLITEVTLDALGALRPWPRGRPVAPSGDQHVRVHVVALLLLRREGLDDPLLGGRREGVQDAHDPG